MKGAGATQGGSAAETPRTSETSRSNGSGAIPGFGFLLVSRGLGLLGDQIALFAVPVAVYLMTRDIAFSGLAVAAQWVPRLVALPFLGRLVDRYDTRMVYIVVDLARAAIALALVAVSELWVLLIAVGALSLLNGVAYLVLEHTLAHGLSGARLARTQSRLQIIEHLARVFGPVLGAAILAAGGVDPVMACVTLLFLTSALMLGFFDAPVRAGRGGAEAGGSVLVGVRLLLGSGPLRDLTLLTMLSNLLTGLITAAIPAIVVDRLHRDVEGIGLLYATAAIGSAAVLLQLSRTRRLIEAPRLGDGALLASFAAAAVLAVVPSYPIFCLAFCLYTVSISVFVVHLRTERVRHMPHAHFAQVLGVHLTFILSTIPLAGLIVTLIGDLLPPAGMILAGLAAVVAAFGMMTFRKARS